MATTADKYTYSFIDGRPAAYSVSLVKVMSCDRCYRRWRHYGPHRLVDVISAQHPTFVRRVSVLVVVGDGRVSAYKRPISGGAVVAAVRRTHAPAVCAAHRLVCSLSLQERSQVQETPIEKRKRKRRRNRKYVDRASRGVQ